MADDLEPNFLLDQNVSLASDDELGATADAQPTNPHRSLEDEDDFALEGEWNGLTTQGSPSQDTEDPKATKKRKKKERQKENKAKKRRLQEEQQQEEQEPSASGKVEAKAAPRDHPTGASANPANQSPADIAEYFIKMQHKTFGSGVSALELADMLIPESSIIDASQYAKARTKDTLPEFIRQDGLKLTNLEYIILDLTHRDAKNRTLLDIPETRKEVFASLFGQGSTGSNGGKAIMEHVKDGKIKLLLY
ncbi:hypothetical protein FRC05_000481 [Tulasnella sp. 425]|nr:hypothetical protein FRC05_000481 [Tulasnella sp. 425]